MSEKKVVPVILRRWGQSNLFHGKMTATKFKELQKSFGAKRATFIYPAYNTYREVGGDGTTWFYIPAEHLARFLGKRKG